MRGKPKLIKGVNLPSINSHKYERYLPNAFDESLSILEKINRVIYQLNEYSEITDVMLVKWNEVYEWVLNEGLDESVVSRINELLVDGSFNKIINEEIFSDLTNRITDLVDELNTLIDETGDLSTEIENNKVNVRKNTTDIENIKNDITKIVVSEEQPIDIEGKVFWYEVIIN